MRKHLLVGFLCTYSLPSLADERSLLEWDISRWNPESQAACGAVLSKFGLLASIKSQTEQVYQILYEGYAMNSLSESTDPSTNALAWSANVSTQDEGFYEFISRCSDLFQGAHQAGLIPSSIDAQAAVSARSDLNEAGQ